jgi:hypothetical protein
LYNPLEKLCLLRPGHLSQQIFSLLDRIHT